MVALSLYKGNLHRVPEIPPRQWLMPTPKISLKNFKILLRRRSRALARLQPLPPSTTNPNPNPETDPKSKSRADDEVEVEVEVEVPPVLVPVKTEKEDEDVRVEAVKLAEKLVISPDVVPPKVDEVVEADHQKLELTVNITPSCVEWEIPKLESIYSLSPRVYHGRLTTPSARFPSRGRGRGRPKKYWWMLIRHDMEQLQFTEDMTLDRKMWRMQIRIEVPTPKISVKEFKTLLRRRSRALALLQPPLSTSSTPTATSNPNPEIDSKSKSQADDDDEIPHVSVPVETEKEEEDDVQSETLKLAEKLVISSDVPPKDVPKEIVDADKKLEVLVNPPPSSVETSNKENAADEQKRKEIEDKLQILNMKKHGLVQLLKQILNAEEELKRRSMQGVAIRPSLPLRVDTTNDTGSMTKLNTPRMGSDGNPIGEVDGDGGDDASNQNTLSRNLLRTSSTSPSSDSQLRKTPYNVRDFFATVFALHTCLLYAYLSGRSIRNNPYLPEGPLSSRSVGVTVSPSRFAPPGQQGQPSNLPPMSLSGTNFAASSPSPVASGGTSAFRDRFSSP
ncbi:putative beta-1,3-galactosyltransferase 19-like [Capsicum annuum]|nr:putative beta-1,3-galactosyltransferase 19-like [Capsicum annuum]